MTEKSVAEAIHDALEDALAADDRVFLLGEDVEAGGVFRFTDDGGRCQAPVVVGDDPIAVRSVMNLTIAFDHRVADGCTTAAFTRHVRDRLQVINDSTNIN